MESVGGFQHFSFALH